mgnify:CR=1 FL=1
MFYAVKDGASVLDVLLQKVSAHACQSANGHDWGIEPFRFGARPSIKEGLNNSPDVGDNSASRQG